MNGWEAITLLGQLIFWIWVVFFAWAAIWVTVEHIGSAIKARSKAARAWREGYEQGINDERLAAAIDIPEYRIPNRQNPYGKSESPTR